ncbi:unnamed protein product [Pieris brassicae]|uniref:Major facilitator superfamily (MFS) profile domain-containing protein n=1 Tax=Pieris brassicae TaxID=7116 RepID=A0A9P0TII4_PIEBR|nr:unnamed protein product [Pieris brassicae]
MSEYKENNENTQKQDDLLCDQDVRYPKKDSAVIKVLRKHCCIPQQWVFGVISLIGLCNAYTMRVTLNLAITQMVNRTKIEREHFDPDACPSEEIIGNITALVDKSHAIFDWNEEVQGFILSGFYYGYGITQILGGFLAEKYEAKWTLGIGLLTTAILTFLTPLITKIGGSTWLFILRVLQGMGEGPTIPALMIMMSRWTPPDKRAFQGALIFGGAQLGNMFGSLMGGTLMAGGRDWAYVFYFFGGFGVVWFIFWSLLCYNEPNQHPFISYKELDYLNRVVKRAKVSSSSDPVPWKAMLRSPAAWALLCAGIGHDWGFYTMVSDLPKYMHDVLKFNIAETGSMLPATCIILASYSGCNRTVALGCFVLAMGFMGGNVSGMKVNILDVAPNHAGSVSAFINTITTFAGIISPYLIGLMTPDSTLVQWRRAFWICFVMMVGSNILYGFLADGKQQWWDDVRQFGYPSNWKHGPIIKEVPTEPESIKLCKKDEEETQK